VLKKPKPSAQEVIEMLIPPLITTMVGLSVLDEFVKAMDGYEYRHKEKEVEKE